MVLEEEINKLLGVNVLRGEGGGIWERYLTIAKIRCLKRWTGGGVRMEEKYEIKVSKLRRATCKIEY